MARILNIEKSEYITQNIEAYTANKLGQYNKYLDKSPLFVTWFHINETHTRSDVGSGGIHSELGPSSPIRYTQINHLPVYNIPELKPDIRYEEDSGLDTEIEINDGYLLPNTIKASPGDYFLIVLPGAQELLFSVNDFDMNTIQSNDYYVFSAHMRRVGNQLIDLVKPQVVEEYETIFENIGTEDKCFLRVTDIPKVNDIGKLFLEMRELYVDHFFDKQTGHFVCKNNDIEKDGTWFYDSHLERFIMDSQIFFDSFDTESILLSSTVLTDVPVPESSNHYKETLYYAIKNRDVSYLASHPYYYLVEITRRLSPFVINHINCKGVNLEIMNHALVDGHSDGLDSGMLHEYFPHTLLQLLKGEIPPMEGPITEEGKEPDGDDSAREEEEPNPNESLPEDPITTLSFLEKLVYDFGTDHMPTLDRKELAPYSLRVDSETYQMIPLVLFILKNYYDGFFKKEEI